MAKKRAESRSRYFIRTQSTKRGWDVSHISKGGNFVEEQEVINSFPDIGLRKKLTNQLNKLLDIVQQ